MLRELVPASGTTFRLHSAEELVSQARPRSVSAMTDLFVPLDRLLSCGGDPRLSIDPASRVNEYSCQPFPCPDTLSFASSTATSISARAYDRVSNARESLMQSAIAIGIDAAFDARIETMLYRGLAGDARNTAAASGHGCDPEMAAKICLVGKPVALARRERHPVAALRICAGARLVTETWSSNEDTARDNLQRELGRIGAIVSKIEWLAAHINDLNPAELCHEA